MLLISVEEVGKKPAGIGALPSRWEDPDNCVSTGLAMCWYGQTI